MTRSAALSRSILRGHLANCRQGLDDRTLQFEMLVPGVSPRIEEPDHPAGTVKGCDVGPLVTITEHTGVGQIGYTRGAAVLAADDMINLVRKADAILVHQTIFASSTGTLDHKLARGVFYLTSH